MEGVSWVSRDPNRSVGEFEELTERGEEREERKEGMKEGGRKGERKGGRTCKELVNNVRVGGYSLR